MNQNQRRALEQVRDTCAMLHSFMDTDVMDTDAGDQPLQRVLSATFQQLTDDLLDAVTAAESAGVPEHLIFDSM
ncbi:MULTISPECIES: hypothetical protein [unclassified Rhodococcus (in: high G+C Gram-positive bacteria)]|uniref:hypothetical protein n=1 Tax=unclassified Rhodococcus (in: high G+C Gram-positive bacteria) TaxID=192944 RepID=UPI001639E1C1|nr:MULTISPECIES: hypothetical protein [unclassified Rhodococcus (in: high G+C Gram-positive bacteria)]MBC2638136.1 hypothetical protein [Rhodococcus sp. 3A]MBC2897120.1 hypothetical protein [Rhodococcus sp. 4CII]